MMHRHAIKLCAAGLAAVALAAGCGNGSPATPEASTIAFGSPAVDADGVIGPKYQCGGGALWLPLEWGPVPSGTKELAIYIGRFKYEKAGQGRKLVVPFAELVSSIQPSLRRNPPSILPQGAGWSYFGISCPPKRTGQHFLQVIFALDRTQPERTLDRSLATRLTEEALDDDGSHGNSRSPGLLTEDAVGIGRFIATYDP